MFWCCNRHDCTGAKNRHLLESTAHHLHSEASEELDSDMLHYHWPSLIIAWGLCASGLLKRLAQHRSIRVFDGAEYYWHQATAVIELMNAKWLHQRRILYRINLMWRITWVVNLLNWKPDLFIEVIVSNWDLEMQCAIQNRTTSQSAGPQCYQISSWTCLHDDPGSTTR